MVILTGGLHNAIGETTHNSSVSGLAECPKTAVGRATIYNEGISGYEKGLCGGGCGEGHWASLG